jgi:hypothetical protein
MKTFVALAFFLVANSSFAQGGTGKSIDEIDKGAEVGKLKRPLEALQSQLEPQTDSAEKDTVDLSGEEFEALPAEDVVVHVLARPWYQNIDISGFGAVWFADSGADGTRPHAGFVIKETTLFVEAEAWEDISFFFEVQTSPLQQDHESSVRTGEVYLHFHNVLKKWGDGLLGIKAGRIDIPFGEEYLWQDAPDNSLISNSAAYPWLWDEGILFYGRMRGVGWLTAITDGHVARSQEDGPEKALNAKVYGTPWERLYLSASIMKNGATERGALLVGGSLFQPVGAGGASSAGRSPNDKVDATLYELDANYHFSSKIAFDLAFGQAFVEDADAAFDRRLTWFSIQGRYDLGTGSVM